MLSTTVRAPAKINIYLEVLGRRADGYHDLETVFQALSWHDLVKVSIDPDGPPHTKVTCTDARLNGPDNLAHRAVSALRHRSCQLGSVHVHITKHLPIGGGLGGGSSNAAAVLRAVTSLLPDPPPMPTLTAVAAELGADVPFFLHGGTAYADGRGDHILPLDDLPSQAVTLLLPPIACATPQVFAALDDRQRGPRQACGPATLSTRLRHDHGGRHNRLQAACARAYPAIMELFTWLDQRRLPWLLSGSGSTCIVFADGVMDDPPPGVQVVTSRFASRAELS